ncbi:MAG: HAMP domain-containing sensor histidine kinase [Acidimicrobiales bacterium]
MRRRLFLVTLAVTSLLVAAFAIPLALLVRDVARDRAITDAEDDQAALAPVLAVDPAPDLLAAAIGRTPSGQDGRFAVLLPDGTQIGDQTELSSESVRLARDQRFAFSESVDGGIDVYGPVVLGTDDVVVLRVHVLDSLATEGVATSWLVLGLVAVVLLGVAVIATDRLARSVTRPAADLARTSRALAAGDTRARAAVTGPPEIVDVAEALNLLADRIDELLAAERERVADLSHRLRTPLTALRLDAERSGAPELLDGVDRLEAAVSEFIRSARRPLHEAMAVRSDLAEVAEERAAFWGALADDDGRAWACTIEPAGPHPVRLPREDVVAALDVVLGNVFAHTAEGTPYALSVRATTDRVELAVEDGGQGIADAGSLLDRGSSAGGSTGLGLDIAAGAAQAAGGFLRIERSEPLGGARIVFDVPRAEESRGSGS